MRINKSYTEYIKQLDIPSLRSREAWFNSALRTTKLMTDLRHRFDSDTVDERCEDAFDVLYMSFVRKRARTYFNLGTLVVLYIPQKIRNQFCGKFSFADRRVTFTNFKKLGFGYWVERCLNEPYKEITLSNGHTLKLWNTPFILEATTDYDKDFRKEWIDGCLDYQGNEYGDTSTFYIIGSIDRKDCL